MTWEQEIKHRERIVREKALEEGEQKKALETAKNFLKNEIDPNLIAKCTGLPLEQVMALQKEVCVVHSDGSLSAGPSLALSSKI